MVIFCSRWLASVKTMSEDKTPRINIDLSDALWVLVLFLLLLLFIGTPDLYDVIMNRLSEGQVPIPAPKG